MTIEERIESLKADGFGWWLAGFFEAEGSFLIRRHTLRRVGTTRAYYRAELKVPQRADRLELLADIRDRVGCGKVYVWGDKAEYRGQSNEDVQFWNRLFTAFPLLGEKRAEHAIWSRAVETKMAGPGLSRSPQTWAVGARYRRAMHALKAGLERTRAEAKRRASNRCCEGSVSTARREPHSGARHFFAGFVAGDGHLGVAKNRSSVRPTFSITVRADNASLLYRFRALVDVVGCLSFYHAPHRNPRAPIAIWQVSSHQEHLALVQLFNEVPLRGMAGVVFRLWEAAVAEHGLRSRGDWHNSTALARRSLLAKARLLQLRSALGEMRGYRPETSLSGWQDFATGTLVGLRNDEQLSLLAVA